MRTLVWFAYFWMYLLLVMPRLKKARRLREEGRVEEHDRMVRENVDRWARRLLRLAGAQVTVEGQENIAERPVVFVADHQGYFDIPLMLTCLDKPNPIIAKAEIEKLPLIRSWMRELNCLFLQRDDARQSMEVLKEAQNLLQKGYSVVIFPEGTRSKGGPVKEFKAGAIRVATRAGVPIVPVCIDGSYRLMEGNHMWIRPAKVKVTCLPPVPTEGMSREEIRALPERLREMICQAGPLERKEAADE